MSTIQEIAEQLVNLSVKEVNELTMTMKHDKMDMPAVRYDEYKYNKGLSSKEYGQRKIFKRRKV